MTKLAEIQEAIQRLTPEEQQALRYWLYESQESDDAALETALQRQQDSKSGQGTSRPYQDVIASARAMLAKPDESRTAPGS
jgi:hypothetical protein